MDTIAIDQTPEIEAVAPVAIEPAAAPATASSDVALADGAPVVDSEPSAIPQAELDAMTELLIERLKTVYDPEIPVDIYELGLIYRVDISDDRDVVVDMTLTAPGCPVAGDMPGWVQDAVEGVQGVRSCNVNLTFDPPWDPSRMSDEAKLQLNMF
jgi:FeS assembly SUF system protein